MTRSGGGPHREEEGVYGAGQQHARPQGGSKPSDELITYIHELKKTGREIFPQISRGAYTSAFTIFGMNSGRPMGKKSRR